MAGEIIYADLDISPEKHCRKLHSLPQPGTSGCPEWHRTALWASWTGNLLLGVAVVVVGYLLFRQQLENPGSCDNGSRNVGDGNATLENIHLKLRKDLCLPNLQEGEGCKVCPVGWALRRTKCYWVASGINPWSQSRQECVNRSAELLMLEDQDELDFIKETVQKPSSYLWIGLSLHATRKGWTWLNGSRLDQSRFQLSSRNKNSCGAIKGGTIIPESCSSGLQWICQKEATPL